MILEKSNSYHWHDRYERQLWQIAGNLKRDERLSLGQPESQPPVRAHTASVQANILSYFVQTKPDNLAKFEPGYDFFLHLESTLYDLGSKYDLGMHGGRNLAVS